MAQIERDFPPGHPAASDYNPSSPEAIEWARLNVAPFGKRDFPVDHPKAVDTPGNTNHVPWENGVDPHNPHREPFTGRTPEQAAGVAAMTAVATARAKESPVSQPLNALEVNAALDKKRLEVGRDLLTPEEYSEVIAQIQQQPRAPETEAQIRDRIEKQHLALGALIARGFTRATALEMIAHDGADKILGITAGSAG
jgi:hypothetical protein